MQEQCYFNCFCPGTTRGDGKLDVLEVLVEGFKYVAELNKTCSVVRKVIKTSLLHPPTTRVNWEVRWLSKNR